MSDVDLDAHRICNADHGRVACYCSALDWMTLDQYGEHVEAIAAERVRVAEAAAHHAATISDSALGISDALNASYAAGTDPELILWRRLTKVSEEAGEVQNALRGYVGENPRKGFTHSREDLITELLDCAGAALGAVAHLTNDDTGLARLADRLVFVLSRLTTPTPDEGSAS
jgi:hypothetical protein